MNSTLAAKPQLLLLELNEVNRQLLEQAVRSLPLPNLAKIISFAETTTITDDVYDSGYLEPWVQWVSIHTGKPASSHQIMHLGDVPNLEVKQIWETLGKAGLHSGIWGIMNGSRREAAECDFFLADPWTFSAKPYPAKLSGLTEFACYIAKNYLNLSPVAVMRHSFTYLVALLQTVPLSDLLVATKILCQGVFKFGAKNMVLGAFYEFVSAAAFVQYKQKYKPQFSIIFLNLLAHIQHHYWRDLNVLSPELVYGFQTVDLAVGKILDSLGADEVLIVANALSQSNTKAEKPWVLYRPDNPKNFLAAVGINFDNVEELMTHDAHIFFASDELCKDAFNALSQATIAKQKLFYVQADAQNNRKLFYRLEFTDEVNNDASFELGGKTFRFFDYFKKVVVRTGKHCQQGFVLQSKRLMPEQIENQQIYDYICRYFAVKAAETNRLTDPLEDHLPDGDPIKNSPDTQNTLERAK